ncbi:MAG: sterol desaturase/sphingolipid hydroxylase (fatty acid hydroxylase superfamily) [Chlamydiales bacterium]|jgi:sterol desaturase/sphingolipid hydroxylase (fatty acid hydroxylase superfamily)
MQYIHWLIAISIGFALLERIRPARPEQRFWRPQLANDVFYLFFNGHFYALLSAGAVGWAALQMRNLLAAGSLLPEHGFLNGRHFAVQFIAYFVIADFMQWCIHVVLHRVPRLWQFHKIHHSIHTMDWAGNFRFHWIEVVIYRSLLYLPLLFLGAPGDVILAVAVCGTAWGHFNHSNIDLDIGPLAYVFNSPRMHLWHHDASTEGGVAKNFGIVLSLWDFLFSTAFWPRDRTPERLGFDGDPEVPNDIGRQLLFPVTRANIQEKV